jgi:hypothetical protein
VKHNSYAFQAMVNVREAGGAKQQVDSFTPLRGDDCESRRLRRKHEKPAERARASDGIFRVDSFSTFTSCCSIPTFDSKDHGRRQQ